MVYFTHLETVETSFVTIFIRCKTPRKLSQKVNNAKLAYCEAFVNSLLIFKAHSAVQWDQHFLQNRLADKTDMLSTNLLLQHICCSHWHCTVAKICKS